MNCHLRSGNNTDHAIVTANGPCRPAVRGLSASNGSLIIANGILLQNDGGGDAIATIARITMLWPQPGLQPEPPTVLGGRAYSVHSWFVTHYTPAATFPPRFGRWRWEPHHRRWPVPVDWWLGRHSAAKAQVGGNTEGLGLSGCLRICEPEGYSSAEIARQRAQMPASPDQSPFDCDARGNECGLGSLRTRNRHKGGKDGSANGEARSGRRTRLLQR